MQKLTWLHLSDIHFSRKTQWRDSASLTSLLECLTQEFNSGDLPRPDLIFCTGDIAYGEASANPMSGQYEEAKAFFDKLLTVCGEPGSALPKERLFVVPGNHDVNRGKINNDAQDTLTGWAASPNEHIDKINQRFEERPKEFLQAMSRLDNYAEFVRDYLPHQVDTEGRHHYGVVAEVNGLKVGIAGFNSAWTCAGPEDDRNLWLASKWQFNKAHSVISNADIKIGLIHHPTDWLNLSDRDTANTRIPQHYDFWLHGHSHNAWVSPGQYHTVLAAGAVGAEHSEEFGFNVVSVDSKQSHAIAHLFTRKADSDWTPAPIAPHAPRGKWSFDLTRRLGTVFGSVSTINTQQSTVDAESVVEISKDDYISRLFSKKLKDALLLFSSHHSEWIQPVVSKQSEVKQDIDKTAIIDLKDLVENPRSSIIEAPPQYGLTCLAHYLVKEAWSLNQGALWLYLDAHELKPNLDSITSAAQAELELLSKSLSDVKCVILDSWSKSRKDSVKLLNKVSGFFKDVPIICMLQMGDDYFSKESIVIDREFEGLYLWSMSRQNIRKLVTAYNDAKQIGDESSITSRIISDLDVLNLHRTPLNCLTLLKVSEVDFDESPVNRSEIIKRVLFLLFNFEQIPTYKTRPDLKDCEYVLGYLCEHLIRAGEHGFTRTRFLREIQDCCQDRLIDLDIQVVFDVLYVNNIVVERGGLFYFKSSYWIFYFAAQRMHHDQNFAAYIFEDMRYAQHAELIEFYTGIDRRREDAIKVLIADLRTSRVKVKENCGLPEDLNPYRLGKWKTSDETELRMQQEIANGVAESALPDFIKDQFADKDYDPARPYNQNISSILSEHSFVRMMQGVSAGARALRNSDYVTPELKRELLSEIMLCWHELSKILFIVLPVLVRERNVLYDGVQIILAGECSGNLRERFFGVLQNIPSTVAFRFADDLYSMKMGPLLFDQLHSGKIDDLSKHELILLIINKRPRDWNKEVSKYIANVQHNSFYLLDIYNSLRTQYSYAFASPQALRDIEYLIKMAAIKHSSGKKSPAAKDIKKARFNIDVIPEREV